MISDFQPHVNLIKIYDGVKEPYAQSFVSVTGWGATRVIISYIFINIYISFKSFYTMHISFFLNQLHAVFGTQQGRHREPNVKTLRSSLFADF